MSTLLPSTTCGPRAPSRATAGLIHWAPAVPAALALALSARLQVPFMPLHIPFSLQSPTVLVIAALLGRRRAVAAVLAVLGMAAAGAPVLAGLPGPAAFVGLRAGYLWGFAAAAAYLGHGRRAHHLLHWWVGTALILTTGWAWLSVHIGAGAAWAAGVAPFWLADVTKATMAMSLWRLAGGGRSADPVGR